MSRKRGGHRGGRRGAGREQELLERAGWILDQLLDYEEGIHEMGQPAVVLDSALPPSVEAVYREFDGASLFHEGLVLFEGRQLRGNSGRIHVGHHGGDDIFVDERGRVFRLEEETGELLEEGSRFDRWLAGVIDAESVIYDKDGEFRDEIFDEMGELTDEASAERERRILKRDTKAVAPRWRLARALFNQEKYEEARTHLEEVVTVAEDFAWAWFDLARVSEELEDFEAASDEAMQAAECRPDYEHRGFFLAHAARFADASGDDARAKDLAARALAIDPDLPRRHREGAKELLAEEDVDAARELLVVAKVLAPRDLEVIDLLRQIES